MKSQFLKFLVSKTFFKNLGISILILIILLIITQVGLRIYAEHGKEVSVPSFTGMPLKLVDQICYEKGLLWLIQDSVFVRDSAPGIVMDQYPSAGSRVKQNRKIFLTTNAWSPEVIKMPKAYDIPLRQAERLLQSSGLTIAAFEYMPYFAENHVLEQKLNGAVIPEGTPIPKGTGITLVIGQGLSNIRADVPKLLNLCRDSAQALAIGHYFNIGAVTFDYSVFTQEDSMNALVYRQFPQYQNQQARLGSSIDIWLTIDSVKLMELDSLLMKPDTLNLFESESDLIE